VAANDWAASFFPNFYEAHVDESRGVPEVLPRPWLERALDLGPAQLLEWSSRRLLGAWLRRLGKAPGVILSSGRLKLHRRDHRPRLSDAFAAALREAGDDQLGSPA
jgi:hypothetical protein